MAGWLVKFIEHYESAPADDAQALRGFLANEALSCGPDNVRRKGYWICKLAPEYCFWSAPAHATKICQAAGKSASIEGLTGGAVPITIGAMRATIRDRHKLGAQDYQAMLFAICCYTTISRGAEIYALRAKDVKITPTGDVRIRLERTKTRVNVTKLVPNVRIDSFNPAAILKAWIKGLNLEPHQRIWRSVLPNNRLSTTDDLPMGVLRRQIKAVFGKEYSLHSFRKGAASALAIRGAPVETLLAAGTWARITSLRSYIGDAIRTNPEHNRQQTKHLLQPLNYNN